MSDESDSPRIPIVCPSCETRTRVPFSEVENAVTRHNDAIHDGEAVATVDPDVFDRLADYVATDLGLLEK